MVYGTEALATSTGSLGFTLLIAVLFIAFIFVMLWRIYVAFQRGQPIGGAIGLLALFFFWPAGPFWLIWNFREFGVSGKDNYDILPPLR